MKRIFTLSVLYFVVSIAFSQPAFQKSVLLQASVENNPPSIQLKWNKYTEATNYYIYRRTSIAAAWGSPLATVPPSDSTWTDTNVAVGKSYEYRVFRNGGAYPANGYLNAAINLPAKPNKGRIIVLADSVLVPKIEQEIARYLRDLTSEGWVPIYHIIPREMPVPDVKAIITAEYNIDPTNTKSLFLIGHIPVPYSGDLNPDGHPDHQGAWPADVYYADLNGTWTDASINDVSASDPRNRNIPEDGKFDQTIIPSPVELETGRVDFNNLPAFPDDEAELLRKYFDKNHAFRTKAFTAERRGVLEDNFGSFAEGFSQSGYKNFSSMFGINNVHVKPYRNTLQNESYMWSYGCGGGNYVSASGINSTSNLVTDSLQTVFTMLFGSYFGDWDTKNNFLRSALASGQTLTNAWSGRPIWQFHHMALGESIGYSAKLSMNNNGSTYEGGYGAQFVHIALMGDPTLVQYTARPVQQLDITEQNGHILLSWSNYDDAHSGFELFKRYSSAEAFALVSSLEADVTSYIDSCAIKGQNVEYCVRALIDEASASGTFQILSPGALNNITPTTESPADLSVSYSIANEHVTFTTTSNASSYHWDFGDGNTSTDKSPLHSYSKSGTYTVILTTTFECVSKKDTFSISVILTGETDLLTTTALQLYPTIANDQIQLHCQALSDVEYSIISTDGKLVKNGILNPGLTILSVKEFNPGIYQIVTESRTLRFVIQR